MNLVRWQPKRARTWDPFRDFFGDNSLDRFFDGTPGWYRNVEHSWSPALDVAEHEDHYFVKMDLPGLDRKDIELRVENTELTISGERKQEDEQKKNGFYHCERMFGKFERSLTLPTNVDTNKVDANFKNGVLEVRIPKKEESKARSIEIKD